MTLNSKPILFVLCLFVAAPCWAQLPSQDPGHKEYSEVAGIKFSVPKRFDVQKPATSNVVFMLRAEYELGLFVAVPDAQVDEKYLTDLSNTLASKLLPKENGFQWKLLPDRSDKKVSDFQVGGGNTKGLNGKKLIQTDYILIDVKGRKAIVGYITKLGRDSDGQYLFDLKTPAGMSMPGWYAQAHIIASITGEK